MVSRDRLRFHVQIDHKWEEWADLNDVGRRPRRTIRAATGRPSRSSTRARTLITTMWDQRAALADLRCAAAATRTGNCINTVGFANDGWRNRQPLGSLSVFRGNADFVFYQRDLFTRATSAG